MATGETSDAASQADMVGGYCFVPVFLFLVPFWNPQPQHHGQDIRPKGKTSEASTSTEDLATDDMGNKQHEKWAMPRRHARVRGAAAPGSFACRTPWHGLEKDGDELLEDCGSQGSSSHSGGEHTCGEERSSTEQKQVCYFSGGLKTKGKKMKVKTTVSQASHTPAVSQASATPLVSQTLSTSTAPQASATPGVSRASSASPASQTLSTLPVSRASSTPVSDEDDAPCDLIYAENLPADFNKANVKESFGVHSKILQCKITKQGGKTSRPHAVCLS